MDLTKPPSLTLRGRAAWPNLFVFPKELRDAIPDYGARALVFDAVSGSTHNFPAEISGLTGAMPSEVAPRTQAQFLVHETGKLDGKFVLWVDLDSTTMRALGQFLVGLSGPCRSAAKIKRDRPVVAVCGAEIQHESAFR